MGTKVSCTICNDTKYDVEVDNYFGNQYLNPGESVGIWLYEDGNYFVSLILKIPGFGNFTKRLYNYQYKNRTHRMSTLFQDEIGGYERTNEREREQQREKEKQSERERQREIERQRKIESQRERERERKKEEEHNRQEALAAEALAHCKGKWKQR